MSHLSSLKTNGIVIKRMDFGEADRILTILTERFGKIKAIAKGVRKSTSKLGGHLEPFMIVDFQLHEGKTFFTITGASIISEFPCLHAELPKMAKAYVAGELIDNFLHENEKSETTYKILTQMLELVENNEKNFLINAFALKLIETSGFQPEFYDCVHCKEKITEGENFWDNLEGGVICEDCVQESGHGVKISNEFIKSLRFIEQNDFPQIEKLKLNKSLEDEIDRILENYIRSILDKNIKSKKFLNNVK
ncbi:MAG: DNA repair protein RecO [bacterium ADurb.BinA186]|nr:MAG: DNA repair protein RecO [bacterium ADurb.BinA186]